MRRKRYNECETRDKASTTRGNLPSKSNNIGKSSIRPQAMMTLLQKGWRDGGNRERKGNSIEPLVTELEDGTL